MCVLKSTACQDPPHHALQNHPCTCIYRQNISLYQLQPEHVPNTYWNFSRSQSPSTIINSAFPQTICRWNSLPANVAEAPSFWILQMRAIKSVSLSCLARPCKYTLVIPSSFAVGDFVCPGTHREGSLVEDWRVEMHWPKLLFFLAFYYTCF